MTVSTHSIFDMPLVYPALAPGVLQRDNWYSNSSQVWSRDRKCALNFGAESFPETVPIVLEILVFNASPETPKELTIHSPGHPSHSVTIISAGRLSVLGHSPVHADGALSTDITLELDRIESPAKLGQSADDRLLGLTIRSLLVLDDHNTPPLHFTDPDTCTTFLRQGWDSCEPDGIWSVGNLARIVLPGYLLNDADHLALEFIALPRAPHHAPLLITARINDHDVATWGALTDEEDTDGPWLLPLPEELEQGETAEIILTFTNVMAPRDLEINADPRPLGILLKSIVPGSDR